MVVDVGDTAPDFDLRNYDDRSVALTNLLKAGPAVLVFYRGAW